MQEDIKKLIAYSSVAHMGYVTMGIFAANAQGIQGGIFQMLSHGLISGALFLCVGVVYDRMHTREIAAYGGLVNRMPHYAVAFLIFTMANVGLPGTSGFVGELLTLLGSSRSTPGSRVCHDRRHPVGCLCAVAVSPRDIRLARQRNRSKRCSTCRPVRRCFCIRLIVLVIFFGVNPGPVFDVTQASVDALINNYQAAIDGAVQDRGKTVGQGDGTLCRHS